MPGSVEQFTNLVTSEHSDKPNFVATVSAVCQPFSDMLAVLPTLDTLFDVDVAVGQQLDLIGLWVGITRYLSTPITGVYFSLDTAGLGFDEGVWRGPNDPVSGLVAMPDEHYRLVLKARILNNRWDCDIPDAYALAAVVFGPLGYSIIIEDHNDLSMDLGLIGNTFPDALTWELLVGGYFDLKPVGVRINQYYSQTIQGPLFAMDLNTALFAGFDSGGWALVTPA